MFKSYTYRLLRTPFLWICMAATIVVLFLGDCDEILEANNSSISMVSVFEYTSVFGIGQIMAFILFSLPFLYLFSENTHCNVVYYSMIRCRSKRSYIVSSLFMAAISVMFMCSVTIIIFTIICYCNGVDFVASPGDIDKYKDSLLSVLLTKNYNIFYLIIVLSYTLFVLPGVYFGMVASLVIKNKYFICAMPFIGFRFFQMISISFNSPWIDWNLSYLATSSIHESIGGLLYSFLYPVFLSGVLSILYYYVAMRRLKDGFA